MMKQTIRNLLLLTAMIIAGAGQVWANQPDPDPDPTYGILGYSSENAATDGGVLEFYNNADCVEDGNDNRQLSEGEAVLQSWLNDYRTVYIKALPDAIHTLGEDASFITVEKTQATNNINAPRRTPEVGDYCEVTAVAGKTGVYQFTMPNDESINVKVTVTFPSKQTASVSYIESDGTQGTQTAYELDGTETKLGQDNEETWYVCMKDVTFDHGLTLVGNVNIIISDGKNLSVGTSDSGVSDNGFTTGTNHLGFYGQASATGKLFIHNKGEWPNYYCIRLDTNGSLGVSNIDVELKSVNGYGIGAEYDREEGNVTLVGHSTKGNSINIDSYYQCIGTQHASVSIKNYNIVANCSNASGFNVGSLDIEGLEDGSNKVSVSSGDQCLYVRGNLNIKYCDVNLSGNNTSAIQMYSDNTEDGMSFLGHPTKGNTLTVRNQGYCINAQYNPVDIKYYNLVLTGKQIENSDEYGTCEYGINAKSLNIEGLANGTNSVMVNSSYTGIKSHQNLTINYCNVDVWAGSYCIDGSSNYKISIKGLADGTNTVKVHGNQSGIYGSAVDLENCNIDVETKGYCLFIPSSQLTSSIKNCILTVERTSTGDYAIKTFGDLTIDGGQVDITSVDDNKAAIYASGCNITLGWQDAEKDFIKVSSYKVDNASITTAEGQRFVAYIAGEQEGTEVAQAIIEGSNLSSNDINGRTLRPLDGYCVNFDSRVGISAKDEVDFSITNQNATFNYFVFAEGDKVTLKYTKPENGSDLVKLLSFSYGNQEITPNADHSFTMPAGDILYPTVLDITVSVVDDGYYDGKSQQPTDILYSYQYAGDKWGYMTVSENSSDYTVTAIYPQTDVDGNDQPVYSTESIDEAVNAGNYKLSISANGVYFGTTDVEFIVKRNGVLTENTILLNPVLNADNNVYYNYTGQAIEPEVEVTYLYDQDIITIDPDQYTVNYANNLNSGEATVTIQAKTTGNYDFYRVKNFKILDPADVDCGGSMKYSFYSADTDTDNDQVTDIPAGTLILTGEGQISETPWTGYKATLEEDASNAVKTVTINMTGAKIDIPAGAFAGLQAENIKLNFTGTKPTEGEFVVKLNGTALQADENETDKFTIPVASLKATADVTDALFATCVVTEQAPKKGNSNENENFMGYTPTSGNMILGNSAKAWIMTSCDFAKGEVGISEVETGEIPEDAVVLLSGALLSGVDEPQPLPDQITLQSAEGVSDETASIMQEALPNLVASTGIETVEQLITKAMTPKGGPSPGKINVEDYFGYTLRHGAFRAADLKGGKTVSKGTIVLFANYLDVLLKKAFGTSYAPQFTIPIDLGDGEMTVIDEHELRNSNGLSRDGWYTVDGRKLDKQPTAKGLYIRNGRKVVIK